MVEQFEERSVSSLQWCLEYLDKMSTDPMVLISYSHNQDVAFARLFITQSRGMVSKKCLLFVSCSVLPMSSHLGIHR